MRHIITCITKDASTIHCHCHVPVIPEHVLGQKPERCCQNHEQRWRHHQPKPIHRQVMVDAMQQKMQCQANAVVREDGVDVEEEAMHAVFHERPEAETRYPVEDEGERRKRLRDDIGEVEDRRPPHHRHNPPGSFAQGLEEVAEKRRALTSGVVPWAMDLLQIEGLAEATIPDLHQHRPVEVDELVLLVVARGVRLFGQVISIGHAGGSIQDFVRGVRAMSNPIRLQFCGAVRGGRERDNLVRLIAGSNDVHDGVCGDKTDEAVVEYLIRGFGMCVGDFILHDFRNIFACPIVYEMASTGMISGEFGYIVDLGTDGNIAAFRCVVRLYVCLRYRRKLAA